MSQLARNLDMARPHARHVWRDTPSTDADGMVAAFVEIARGDRRKWEFDLAAHARVVNRVMPDDVGGYPVNYGFVPQTIGWDGDPFDALVLGQPIEGGTVVRGRIVGLLLMDDEKGRDAKVVLSPLDAEGQPAHPLDADTRERIARFFRTYKTRDPGGMSVVHGWDDAEAGQRYVDLTHAFYTQCRGVGEGRDCALEP